ncbi:hypothetical protein ACXR0O_19235 [Verrucomicrobiota bacterium sgz303538]
MARNLTWFEARAIAKLEGRPIRRLAWRRWHVYRRTVFLFFTFSPGDKTTTPPEPAIPARVCTNADHTDADFLATDWTDEGWSADGNGGEPPVVTPPGGTTPGTGTGTGSGGSTGGTGTGDTGNGNNGSIGGITGGGWGGPGNPPGPNGNSDPGTGGGGGSSGGGNGGDPDDTTNPDHHDPNPPSNYDYTPLVSLALDPGTIDGPACYIHVPQKGKANITVSVPEPAGGPLKAVLVSVSCLGQVQVASVGPGASQSFQFEGSISPGGTITATATTSGGTGKTWTDTSSPQQWPPNCLTIPATWGGARSITSSTEDDPATSDNETDGYTQDDSYSITGTYAVNPTPGPGKTGQLLPATFGHTDTPDGPLYNGQTVFTPLGGTTTTTKWYVPPPPSISCTIAPNGSASDITPALLNFYDPGANGTVTVGRVTTTTTSSESGPS